MADRAITTTEMQMIPSTGEWSLMRDMAASLVPTGFLPSTIRTPEQAVAIMLKGRELRIPPMQALSNISMVQGKPTVGAELMLALIYRDHGRQAMRVKETDKQHCTIEYRTAGWDGTSEYTFTLEDAKLAGLIKNGPWTQYPAVMLRWRAISQVAKFAFPDSIGGMYVIGELGEDVTVNADGEVLIVSGSVVNQHTGEITQISEGSWDKASRRLHAIANEHGIGHDILHLWANENGFASIRDVPTDRLNILANDLQADPAAAKRWAAKRAANQPQAASDAAPIEAEHRPITEINTAPPTDEEVDAALTNATPGSLPFDVPDARKYQ